MAHLVDVGGGDGDDAGGLVAVVHDFVTVVVGLPVADGGRIDADFVVGDSGRLQETHHDAVFLFDEFVHGRRVVAQLLVDEGPCDLVGRHLALGEALDGDFVVEALKVFDAGPNEIAAGADGEGQQ